IHVTGDDGYAAALAGREAVPAEQRDRYLPFPFLRDDMLTALAAADLVVGRAGSSTLAEVTAFGLPIVIVPYPHAAGHQTANASQLVEAGAGRLVDDAEFGAEALLEAASLLDDAATHAAMSAAARSLGRPGAADAVADPVVAAARHDPPPPAAPLQRPPRGGRRGRHSTRSSWGPRSRSGSASRHPGTSPWPGSPRCGSAVRQTCSPPSTTHSNSGPSCGSPDSAGSGMSSSCAAV